MYSYFFSLCLFFWMKRDVRYIIVIVCDDDIVATKSIAALIGNVADDQKMFFKSNQSLFSRRPPNKAQELQLN